MRDGLTCGIERDQHQAVSRGPIRSSESAERLLGLVRVFAPLTDSPAPFGSGLW
jgi:hypothetical protein